MSALEEKPKSFLTRLFGGNRAAHAQGGQPLSTPLDRLAALAIDTETTGLDVKRDRIVSLAGFTLEGISVGSDPNPLFDLLVHPGRPIPPAATRIHGIGDAAIAQAESFAQHWPRLQPLLGGRVLIGHEIHFDLAVLDREVRRLKRRFRPPPALDTALLFAALHPNRQNHGLDALCAAFDIVITGRHSAAGDALAAARLYLAMLPLLERQGIDSLGAALAFQYHSALAHRRSRRNHW